MSKYRSNELEEFEHPYELEYSSLKSSKNESIKVQNNILKNNNNLLRINNNNKYNKYNKYIQQHNQNNINVKNNNDNIINNNIDNMNDNNSYNNNYRLNDNIKKDIENLILVNKSNKNNDKNINNYNNDNKSKSKSKSKSKKIKNIKNNINNIHTYSTVNDYWENREKKNREKMNKIKKEREQKIYGELYPIPKINKNTQEIIERLKERIYDNDYIPIEDQIEDQINKNIPIKTTKPNNMFFKNNFFTKNNKIKNKMNKSISKIKINSSYDNLMKIKQNNKRAKTPNLKKIKTKSKQKKKKKINMEKISAADIKNLELIMKLRKDEEDNKIKKLEEKIQLENNYIEEKIKQEDEENSPEKIKNEEKNKRKNNLDVDIKVNNYLNKSMNLFSYRSKSSKDYQDRNQNINEIIASRRYLNDILNKDKKIINHSFIQTSSYNTISNSCNQRNIEVFYKNNSKIKREPKKPSPNLNKSYNASNSFYQNNLSLYDPNTKSFRYKHYTEGGSYSYILNNNNIISQKYNNQKNNKENLSEMDKINKNAIDFNQPNNTINNNGINNYNIYDMKNENQEKYNDINTNTLYIKDFNYRNNEINKIEQELEEKNILNEKLLNETNIINNFNNEYKNIFLKNESINNIFNEIDNESLLKYREENKQKLNELKNKKFNKKNNLQNINIFLPNQFEESKNKTNDNQINKNEKIDNDIYKKINSQKYKNILNGEQQKIENNLDYYNKELKINEKKKELLLSKMFGDKYTKERKRNYEEKDNEDNKDNNILLNIEVSNNNFGVEKYLIKNQNINKNVNYDKQYKYESNKYKFIYSPYKMDNGIKKEIKKNDLFNDEDDDVICHFNFQRKHHFS